MSSGSSGVSMTTTSYAILGLLAVKSWTTHELVVQVDRSLRRFWPRARSKLYEEPKKLVALGLAVASDERIGRRGRTRYTVTAHGRAALADWLAEPGAGPILEFEQLLKINCADSGSKSDVLFTLVATMEWVQEQNKENLAAARAYLAGTAAFPERAAQNLVVGRFLTDFYAMVADWAIWAKDIVEDWPDDPSLAVVDLVAQEESVRVAERISELGRP